MRLICFVIPMRRPWRRSAGSLDPLTGEPKWTAFIATGKMAEKDNYPAVYLIDISNGSVIKRVTLDEDVDLNGDGILDADEAGYGRGGILSGHPAIVDSDDNGFVDRMYLASSRGLIYKVNIPDNLQDPDVGFTDCVINTDFADPAGSSIPGIAVGSQNTHRQQLLLRQV